METIDLWVALAAVCVLSTLVTLMLAIGGEGSQLQQLSVLIAVASLLACIQLWGRRND